MEALEILSRYREAIEAELRSILQGRSQPLYRMMEYQLGWIDEQGNPQGGQGGKRLRPTLTLSACTALGGDPQAALPLAVAVELVHNFSLIHDDIQDGNPERHHRPAVWWVWGPAQAINAGDGMHALARLALFPLEQGGMPAEKVLRALAALDSACLSLCEGQYLDVSFQERVDVSTDVYLRMVQGKAGALMACALELGALSASEDQATIETFRMAGQKLGVAFQIRDDILDLWGTAIGKTPSGDILNKQKSLPVVFAFEKASIREKRDLGTRYFKRVLEPGDVPPILEILDSLGARQFSQQMAEDLKEEALRLLEEWVPKPLLSELRVLGDFLVTREG